MINGSFWLKIPVIHILLFSYLEKDRRVRFGLVRSGIVSKFFPLSFSYFLFLEINILELDYWVFFFSFFEGASVKLLVSK